ncbi:UPF0688 protein C1orf174 homolog [Echeneis naucrates]|uniref:Uncharacterized protein n=1 Tax=Echeneis naucrates TaxID=173247 RepID=A0A665TD39_ECHNA|nr:UPF0688 protein C1orf174 homolog [Echeneis naucrates]
MREMPGQFDNLKPRKRKHTSEVKSSRKASTTKKRNMKSSKNHSAAESSSVISGSSKAADPLERQSHISCECHRSAERRRCSASPDLDGQEGKENELRMGLDLDSCRLNGIQGKQEREEMDYDDTSKNIFPDDDSNQILPVEQFFGNLDAVQDFPQRVAGASAHVHRENRRRHYYAREDSDEEEVDFSSMQQENREDTQ